MLRSLRSMLAFRIRATDGCLGSVHDFHFDADSRRIRYLVASLGIRSLWRKVLVPADRLIRPDAPNREIRVSLTRDELWHSANITSDPPIHRQIQYEAWNYYSWICHGTPMGAQSEPKPSFDPQPGANGQSLRYLLGYEVYTTEGKAGLLSDLLVNEETHCIRAIAVRSCDGKCVLVLVDSIRSINCLERAVYLDINRAGLIGAPEFDPLAADNAVLEDRILAHDAHPSSRQ